MNTVSNVWHNEEEQSLSSCFLGKIGSTLKKHEKKKYAYWGNSIGQSCQM